MNTKPDLSNVIEYYLEKGYSLEDAQSAAYAGYLIDLDIFADIDNYLLTLKSE